MNPLHSLLFLVYCAPAAWQDWNSRSIEKGYLLLSALCSIFLLFITFLGDPFAAFLRVLVAFIIYIVYIQVFPVNVIQLGDIYFIPISILALGDYALFIHLAFLLTALAFHKTAKNVFSDVPYLSWFWIAQAFILLLGA